MAARGPARTRAAAASPPASTSTRELELALQNAARFTDLRAGTLRAWLEELVSALAPDATSLGVRLCGDRSMRALNRDYRGRDRVTDVLSFPGEAALVEPGAAAAHDAGEDVVGRHLGDIVVCVPQARRQAVERGATVEHEVRTLLLHGVLHCMGYDHETDGGEMERLERRLRRRWIPAQGVVSGAARRGGRR